MQENTKNGFWSSVIKGVFTALIVTLIGILIFAFIIKFTLLNSGVVKSVNQFIKILSIFLANVVFTKSNAGAIKGALIGAISTALTHVLFSFFGVQTDFGLSFILEVVFGIIVGGISGIIAISVKKR